MRDHTPRRRTVDRTAPTFVSGDVQPGRPIDDEDVTVKDRDARDAPRPPMDPRRRD
jgi:hypothetical protein